MPSAVIIDFEAARTRLRKADQACAPIAPFWYAVPVWAVLAMAMTPPLTTPFPFQYSA